MLLAPDLEFLVDHRLDRRPLPAPELEQTRQQHARIALEPRIAVGELVPRGRPGLDHGAVERHVMALDGEGADVLAVAAGVAVERAANRARDTGGELQPRERAIAALVDELEKVDAASD